jgi:hypothetical protein
MALAIHLIKVMLSLLDEDLTKHCFNSSAYGPAKAAEQNKKIKMAKSFERMGFPFEVMSGQVFNLSAME